MHSPIIYTTTDYEFIKEAKNLSKKELQTFIENNYNFNEDFFLNHVTEADYCDSVRGDEWSIPEIFEGNSLFKIEEISPNIKKVSITQESAALYFKTLSEASQFFSEHIILDVQEDNLVSGWGYWALKDYFCPLGGVRFMFEDESIDSERGLLMRYRLNKKALENQSFEFYVFDKIFGDYHY
jgi:hypothetical protein